MRNKRSIKATELELILPNGEPYIPPPNNIRRPISPMIKDLIDALVPIWVNEYLAEHSLNPPVESEPRRAMWIIYKLEESGELTEVSAAENRAEAEAVAERMRKLFSAEYLVKESDSDSEADVSN